MPQPDDQFRLRHMLDHAREAVESTQGRSREDVERDRTLELAPARLRVPHAAVGGVWHRSCSGTPSLPRIRPAILVARKPGRPCDATLETLSSCSTQGLDGLAVRTIWE